MRGLCRWRTTGTCLRGTWWQRDAWVDLNEWGLECLVWCTNGLLILNVTSQLSLLALDMSIYTVSLCFLLCYWCWNIFDSFHCYCHVWHTAFQALLNKIHDSPKIFKSMMLGIWGANPGQDMHLVGRMQKGEDFASNKLDLLLARLATVANIGIWRDPLNKGLYQESLGQNLVPTPGRPNPENQQEDWFLSVSVWGSFGSSGWYDDKGIVSFESKICQIIKTPYPLQACSSFARIFIWPPVKWFVPQAQCFSLWQSISVS